MADQLNSKIFNYLTDQIPQDIYALDFHTFDKGKLLQTLLHENSFEALKTQEFSIKLAFIRYFKLSFQRVEVSLGNDQFNIEKSFEYPKQSESFDRSMHDLHMYVSSLEEVKETYRKFDFLYVFEQNKRLELFKIFENMNINIYLQRDYIRRVMYNLFDLNKRDLVLFLRSKLYIRCFNIPKKSKSTDAERRYEGCSPDELALLFDDMFPNGVWEEIEASLADFLKDQLNFQSISNEYFIKNFVPAFMSMIEILLLEYIRDQDRDQIQGLTGYVLRIYFDKILAYTAENLLKHILLRDKNAEKFIKYYDGSVSLNTEGNHVKHHMLIDGNGQERLFSSIISIVIQKQQALGRYKAQKNIIKDSLERLDEYESLLYKADSAKLGQEGNYNKELSIFNSLKDDRIKNANEIESLNKDSSMIKKMTDSELRDKLSNLAASQKRIHNRLTIAEEKFRKIEEVYTRLASQYKNRHVEYKNWQKHYENDKDVLEQIKRKNEPILANYENILNALTKVLAKR